LKFIAKLADYGLEDLTIGTKWALFSALLEVSVEFEQSGVIDLFVVGGEDGTKCREDTRFPVNECAVAIKGENLETVEVEHG
jgi:hypothetical protein